MEISLAASLLFLAAFGWHFGGMVARASEKARPIYGGWLARVLHFAACAVMTVGAPAVLLEIFVLRIVSPFLILAAIIVALFALLFAYALVEQPARSRLQPLEDRGWTPEDAQKSGL
jgi:hypothetical protein